MTTRYLKTVAFAICLLSVARIAMADGVIRNGMGAISSGRGGTNIAHSDNVSIIMDNPAGMVHVGGHGMAEVGGDLAFCDIYYDEAGGIGDRSLKLIPLGQAGFIRRSCDGNWAVGLGIFAPAGFETSYDMMGPLGSVERYKSFGALGKIVPSIHPFTKSLLAHAFMSF